MKVLLTATVQSHICQFHRPLIQMLHEHGCQVHVAAKDNLAEKNGLQLDFVEKVYNVPFSRSPHNLDNVKAYQIIKNIIEHGGYDIVHCNTPMGGIVTRLAARRSRKKGTKVYYTAHGFHFFKGAPMRNWLLYYPIEKVFCRFTDKLITITKEDYRLAKKHFKTDVRHINGVGVDEKRYHPISEEKCMGLKQKMGLENNYPIILCIGELLPNKNQKTGIRAMTDLIKDYPDAKLLIAGNGPEKDKLEDMVQELELNENVSFLGYVTNLEVYQGLTDIVMSCSFREGMPLNIIEAFLSGNPVVASDNRGHRELVKDGLNGYLVKAEKEEEFVHCLRQLSGSKTRRKSFSDKGIIIGNRYKASLVKKQLAEAYFKE